MSHYNEMLCQHVTLSGDAERPKVADAVIEARGFAYEGVGCMPLARSLESTNQDAHPMPHRRAPP